MRGYPERSSWSAHGGEAPVRRPAPHYVRPSPPPPSPPPERLISGRAAHRASAVGSGGCVAGWPAWSGKGRFRYESAPGANGGCQPRGQLLLRGERRRPPFHGESLPHWRGR